MSLPDWLLLTSALLAGAVVLDVLARRVRLPLTVVLAVAGFLVAWLGDAFGAESPLRGERFEEVTCPWIGPGNALVRGLLDLPGGPVFGEPVKEITRLHHQVFQSHYCCPTRH